MIQQAPAKNELCPCESGKKFKKCCGAPNRAVTPQVMTKILSIMVKQFINKAVEAGGSPIMGIKAEQLDAIPHNVGLNVHWDGKEQAYVLGFVKVEQKSKLILPDKRIVR